MTSFEEFKTVISGRENAHLNEDYWEIIDACWKQLIESFPKTYQSLKPIFKKIDKREFENSYDLIYGPVQSGKSRAIMMIMWYSIFMKTGIVPTVLTIKLSSVRIDFMSKMSRHGELNSIVESVILDKFAKYKHLIQLFHIIILTLT